MGQPVDEGTISNSFCVLKYTKDGVPTPVNSQAKLDQLKLTLVDSKTGKISINAPYALVNAVHLTKSVFVELGIPKEEEK